MSGQTSPPPPCLRLQKLMEEAQEHLLRISNLARSVAEALAAGHENVAAALDKEIDLELGRKERCMGALHEHRREHGC